MIATESLTYKDFLHSKTIDFDCSGLEVDSVNDKLFDWQADVTLRALERQVFCLFEDCGLGKTPQQLAYYWGLLLPAVHEQLQAEGFTIPVEAFGISRDIPITLDGTHELLTALCGFVGEDGKHQRLSEMNKYHTIKFIDNVVDFAVANLGMDEEKLKAWRPIF